MFALRGTYNSTREKARKPDFPEPFKYSVDEADFDHDANNANLMAQANQLLAWAKG